MLNRSRLAYAELAKLCEEVTCSGLGGRKTLTKSEADSKCDEIRRRLKTVAAEDASQWDPDLEDLIEAEGGMFQAAKQGLDIMRSKLGAVQERREYIEALRADEGDHAGQRSGEIRSLLIQEKYISEKIRAAEAEL
jgi:hypothetical protein